MHHYYLMPAETLIYNSKIRFSNSYFTNYIMFQLTINAGKTVDLFGDVLNKLAFFFDQL